MYTPSQNVEKPSATSGHSSYTAFSPPFLAASEAQRGTFSSTSSSTIVITKAKPTYVATSSRKTRANPPRTSEIDLSAVKQVSVRRRRRRRTYGPRRTVAMWPVDCFVATKTIVSTTATHCSASRTEKIGLRSAGRIPRHRASSADEARRYAYARSSSTAPR